MSTNPLAHLLHLPRCDCVCHSLGDDRKTCDARGCCAGWRHSAGRLQRALRWAWEYRRLAGIERANALAAEAETEAIHRRMIGDAEREGYWQGRADERNGRP